MGAQRAMIASAGISVLAGAAFVHSGACTGA
ncbi:hypothetical protein GA0115240_134727 [Streptomyces sp. DvalAA-14]|nr:hypothetical protein GA0115240_134727 [Streptomyces sp. DvalAA-14]